MKRFLFTGLAVILVLVVIRNFSLQTAPLNFDKNTILCDQDFDFKNTLKVEEIQNLFEGKGNWQGKKGRSFFADYIDPTTNKPANQIIAEIAEKYQISSRVLVAKIQTESSSIWHYKNMNQPLYYQGEYMGTLADWLLGFGWTDDGVFPKYKGFYNQVENAAKLLSEARKRPSSFRDIDGKAWSVGEPHRVKEKTANNKQILVEIIPKNSATVALYIYTPWLGERDPNTTRDDFGNKLLYNVWKMMFGETGECPPAEITTPAACPPKREPKFSQGQEVVTTDALKVRENPGLASPEIKTQPKGTSGKILEGPACADSYVWWKVEYQDGTIGWSTQDWLEAKEVAVPPPVFGEHPWPMYRHDAQNTGQSSYLGPEKPVLQWKIEGIEEPWIALSKDGTIYLELDEGNFSAINSDGTLKWNSEINLTEGIAIGEDETIYLTYHSIKFSSNYTTTEWILKLTSLNPDGKINWEREITRDPDPGSEKYYHMLGSPIIGKTGTIYVIAGFGEFGSEINPIGALYAFSPQGILKWKFQVILSKFVDKPGPVVEEKGETIYLISGEGNFLAISQEGQLKWQYRIPDFGQLSFPIWSWSIRGDPLIAINKKGVAYFISEENQLYPDEYLYMIDEKGSLKARVNLDDLMGEFLSGNFSLPVIGPDSTLYLIDGLADGILALTEDGQFKWYFDIDEEIETMPIIDGRGVIYFTGEKGMVYALNPDGSLKWQYWIEQFGEHSPQAMAIGKEKTIYLISFAEGDNFLYALREGE